jgi:ethanolamine kinase
MTLQVSVISGGITNLLWKVTPSIPGLEPVVLRVFGDKTEVLIDRENELRTLLYLNQKGFGARVRRW